MNIFFELLDFILTLADLAVQLLDFLLVFLERGASEIASAYSGSALSS